jgi:HD superfamily phosphodiesterase
MKPRELLSPSDESRLQVVGEPKDKEAELVEKFSVNINFGRLHRSTGRPAVPLDVAEREDKREEQAAEQVRPSAGRDRCQLPEESRRLRRHEEPGPARVRLLRVLQCRWWRLQVVSK